MQIFSLDLVVVVVTGTVVVVAGVVLVVVGVVVGVVVEVVVVVAVVVVVDVEVEGGLFIIKIKYFKNSKFKLKKNKKS